MVAISRAAVEQLEAYKHRMGWTFKWVSSGNTDFNYDDHVSFTPTEQAAGEMDYNYRRCAFPSLEAHGISVFYQDDTGCVGTINMRINLARL